MLYSEFVFRTQYLYRLQPIICFRRSRAELNEAKTLSFLHNQGQCQRIIYTEII
jgi:hypothetical protein